MTDLSDAERRRLEAQLLEQLRQDIDECRRIGYRGTVFSSMMARWGPVEACRKVIMASRPPDGFLKLLELNRLDLTTEARVFSGPWRALFDEQTLARARKRLRDYDRPDLAGPWPLLFSYSSFDLVAKSMPVFGSARSAIL
jgi:hypothetical protein